MRSRDFDKTFVTPQSIFHSPPQHPMTASCVGLAVPLQPAVHVQGRPQQFRTPVDKEQSSQINWNPRVHRPLDARERYNLLFDAVPSL